MEIDLHKLFEADLAITIGVCLTDHPPCVCLGLGSSQLCSTDEAIAVAVDHRPRRSRAPLPVIAPMGTASRTIAR